MDDNRKIKGIYEKVERPSWDDYFFNLAEVVASRASCFRAKVGSIIVKDKEVISTGYNGAPSYQKNSLEMGFCYRNENNIKSGTELERCRAIGSHAESNAVVLAAKNGHATNNAIMYIHGHVQICNMCKAIIANSGIKKVYLKRPGGDISIYLPKEDWKVHPIDEK